MNNYQTQIDQILAMVEADQKMRQSENWDPEVDKNNTLKLKEIIKQIGWPTISKVGERASHGAWLLVQHADHDPSFQKEVLELFKKLPPGEVLKRNIAYLEDRIRFSEKRPQLYGTQFKFNDQGELEPQDIEDPDKLEEHWQEAEMGTPTHAEYKENLLKNLKKI